jgi:hypothetical protein
VNAEEEKVAAVDMGPVVGGQVAEYLAEVGAGLIRDTADEWWTIRRHATVALRARVAGPNTFHGLPVNSAHTEI